MRNLVFADVTDFVTISYNDLFNFFCLIYFLFLLRWKKILHNNRSKYGWKVNLHTFGWFMLEFGITRITLRDFLKENCELDLKFLCSHSDPS